MSPLYTPGKVVLAKEFTWNETVWNPSMLSTALWLDAADASTITESGGAVSQWDDKSGNSRNATQSTAGNRPVYQLSAQNGLNAVRFTAASSHFLTAGSTSTWNFLHNGTDSSLFIVTKIGNAGDNPNAGYCLCDTGGLSSSETGFICLYDDRASFGRSDSLFQIITTGVSGAASALDISNNKITPGAYSIISTYLDGNNATASNRILTRVNAGVQFGANSLNNAPTTNNSSYAFLIGRAGNSGSPLPLNGDICEILVFSTQPDTGTRQKLEGYLAHKWGLTASLPSDHPYKTVGPTP